MTLAVQLVGILLVTLVVGVYWGPWIALTRSIARLDLEVFLPVVKQLNANLAALMTVLVPVALLGQIGLLIVDYAGGALQFTLAAAAFMLFVVTVVVTVLIEADRQADRHLAGRDRATELARAAGPVGVVPPAAGGPRAGRARVVRRRGDSVGRLRVRLRPVSDSIAASSSRT